MCRAASCVGVVLIAAAVGLSQAPQTKPAAVAPKSSSTATAASKPPATSAPAGPATSPSPVVKRLASMPALPEMPVVDKRQVEALVAGLSGERYQARRQARLELEGLVNAPGVAEALKAQLKNASDPETKAALEEMVAGHDQPLFLIWCQNEIIRGAANSPSVQSVNQDPGYPWLFVRGNGEFVFDAGCSLAKGRFEQTRSVDLRQGELDAKQLWTLKEIIASSGQQRQPSAYVQPPQQVGGITAQFYVRAGPVRRLSIEFWSMDDISRAAPDRKSSLYLGLAVRDLLAACASEPYAGPFGARGQNIGRPMQPGQTAKLPDWSVAGVDFNSLFQAGGTQVDEQQLKDVREALKKTDTFKYQNVMAFQVFLIPFVADARELHYGR